MITKDTKVIIQGITGRQGQIHARRTIESNTLLVGGTAPGKGGTRVCGRPVYDTLEALMKEHPEANASMILVPPKFVLSAAMEAIEQRIPLINIITEFVPVLDMLKILQSAKEANVIVNGPNTIGMIKPGVAKIGVMPQDIYRKGKIAIISRSGTLTHEVSSNLAFAGFGESICICIGGDWLTGLSHCTALDMVLSDPDTKALILLGEIGGTSEEDVAEKIRQMQLEIPVIGYIAGVSAPEGKKMGHAGAIVSKGRGSARSKRQAFLDAGILVAETTGILLNMVEELDQKMDGALKTGDSIKDRE